MPRQTARQLVTAILESGNPEGASSEQRTDAEELLAKLDAGSAAEPVDYPARDMTITVPAGMTVDRLAEILAEESQQLPVDRADPSRSIGDLVALDICGPRRFGYGTLRDYVIGLQAIDGRGRVFRSGGRVVKNVAGYDLCRLLTGAGDSLAVITEVTLKLKPLPPDAGLLLGSVADWRSADAVLERLNLSAARPIAIDLCSRAAVTRLPVRGCESIRERLESFPGDILLLVAVDGTSATCEWELDRLDEEVRPLVAATQTVIDRGLVAAWCRLAASDATASAPDDRFVRVSTLSSRFTEIADLLTAAGAAVFGRAADGEVFGIPGPESGVDDWTAWFAAQVPAGESLAPARLSVWSGRWNTRLTDSERLVFDALKAELDPSGLLPALGGLS